MRSFILAVVAGTASSAIADPAAPLPLIHARPPITRTLTTSYTCEGGERSFSILYERHAFSRWLSGERRGVRLSQTAVDRATAALRRLSGVSAIVPECSDREDVLMVLALVNHRRAMLFLHWNGDDITASEVQFVE